MGNNTAISYFWCIAQLTLLLTFSWIECCKTHSINPSISLTQLSRVAQSTRDKLAIIDCGFYNNGKRIMLARRVHTVELLDTKTGKILTEMVGSEFPEQDIMLQCAVVSPEGSRVFVGGLNTYTVYTWDVAKHSYLDPRYKLWKLNLGDVYSLALSADGKFLLAGGYGKVILADAITGQIKQTISLPNKAELKIDSVAFSPNGKRALYTFVNKAVLWETHSGKFLTGLRHSRNTSYRITCTNFASDSQTFLTVGTNGCIQLWKNGKRIRTLKSPDDEHISQAVFSINDKQIIAGGTRIHVWDIESGKELRRFPDIKERDPIQRIRLSPNGRYLLSSNGNSATLWLTSTGKCLHRL